MSVAQDPESCPVSTNRRTFIKGLGATVAVTVVGGYAISVWTRDATAPLAIGPIAAPPPATFGTLPSDKTLIVVEMGGGNDGLNTVVPHANPTYYDLRPRIAIEAPLDLDGEVGLHPELTFLAGEYEAGRLAIVEGVGYPDPNLSHFESMSTWWTGDGGFTSDAGWLGRMLDGTVGYEEPLAGITVGPAPSRALLGDASFVVSIQDARGLQPQVPPWIDNLDELMGAWGGFAEVGADQGVLSSAVRQAMGATADARGELSAALNGVRVAGNPRAFPSQMAAAAGLVNSGLAPRVIYVHGFGDYDTHNNQANRHARELAEINEGLELFFGAVNEAGNADRAIVAMVSEFGRRPRDNGSGTDHGTASPVLVAGASVHGGRFGEPPNLSALDSSSNLIHTVDFRSVYATVLDSWLGVDSSGILGSDYPTLPFL